MPIRALLRHHWPAITITVTATAIGCAAVVMLTNMPPRRIVMATGPEGSSYYEDGKRYREALAKAGVALERRLGGNRYPVARSALGGERRPDPERRHRRREYGRPRIIGRLGIRAVVVVPQARESRRGG